MNDFELEVVETSEFWSCNTCAKASYWPKEDGKPSNGCFNCGDAEAHFARMTVPDVLEVLNEESRTKEPDTNPSGNMDS